MKAIAAVYDSKQNKPVLQEIEIERPSLKPNDVLVEVKAVSVNPVDFKVKRSISEKNPGPRILGWDASGTVVEVGSQVTSLQKGDDVYYAGDITRPGSNAEFQAVDEWIVAKKPKSISFEAAASLPLTAITAYESIFHKLKLDKQDKKKVLIIAGAGGVGSIAVQILKQMTNSIVLATASRKESADWVKSLGADHILDHKKDFLSQLKEIHENGVHEILVFSDPAEHFVQMANVILPFGNICSIVETDGELNMNLLKQKSAGFLNEFMFTRSMFQTEDRVVQKKLLEEIASLVDQGKIKSTNTSNLGKMTPENLTKAHDLLLSGKTIGKIVLERI
ncbi:zinc-binding alcohol dehydrogenase family protein [Leptospira idonii]|uniref:Zinc-type alcohol dehydrogenase-like protein n=1 Tax=Leptospira idonii TaxID=1193500 RepID=A0A4R9LZP6_9LEPT|nr:zinc-binding alcohol dehydrogenase family protein [Leptospira idonii]TGN18409.1 zinc-binding alcohol dehydrogenase family protein [Leptospira idonii]